MPRQEKARAAYWRRKALLLRPSKSSRVRRAISPPEIPAGGEDSVLIVGQALWQRSHPQTVGLWVIWAATSGGKSPFFWVSSDRHLLSHRPVSVSAPVGQAFDSPAVCPAEGARTGAGLGYVQIRQDRPQEHIGTIRGDDTQAMPPRQPTPASSAAASSGTGLLSAPGRKRWSGCCCARASHDGLQAPP